MLPTFGQRLERSARRFLPLGTTLLFVLAGVVKWPLPYSGEVAPSLGLIAIYYWSIHRPDLLRPLAVFFLGLLNDAINFLPIGLSGLVFIAVHQLVLSQRRFFVGQIFFMLWSGFAVITLIATLGQWLVLSAYNKAWMAFVPVLLQAVLSVAIFPLPAWVLIKLQRAVLSQG